MNIRFNINNEAKISLDKSVSLGYNGFIKNGIGNLPNLIRVDRKKRDELKKALDIQLRIRYNESIKSGEWFLAHPS